MYVCLCNAVTDRQIREAVDQGATRVRDLRRELGVASCCGRCATCARDVLRQSLADRRQADVVFEPGLGNGPLPQPA